jgi:cell division septation protein DedD
MSGQGSVKRLFFQVILLAAVFVGLGRLAGRTGSPARSTVVDPGAAATTPSAAGGSDEMSSSPDLTFYRTLGKERPSPGGAAPRPATRGGGNNNDVPEVQAPEPAGDRGGAFIVQALATRDRAAAGRLRDRLAGRGFPATVVEDTSSAQTVYRVRVGRYATRAEAEAAVKVLRQKDRLNPWILQEGDQVER